MSDAALRHFVERALGVHAPIFELGFPGAFDWAGLVRDAPAMVERTGGGSPDGSERSWSKSVQERAEAVFRFAHTATLAILCATELDDVDPALDPEADPELALDRFSRLPEDDEELRFEALVSELMGPLEENLLDDSSPLDDRGLSARERLDRVWPHVDAMLVELEARRGTDEEAAQDEVWGVLVALARVAAILATFRWMAAYPDAAEA